MSRSICYYYLINVSNILYCVIFVRALDSKWIRSSILIDEEEEIQQPIPHLPLLISFSPSLYLFRISLKHSCSLIQVLMEKKVWDSTHLFALRVSSLILWHWMQESLGKESLPWNLDRYKLHVTIITRNHIYYDRLIRLWNRVLLRSKSVGLLNIYNTNNL